MGKQGLLAVKASLPNSVDRGDSLNHSCWLLSTAAPHLSPRVSNGLVSAVEFSLSGT